MKITKKQIKKSLEKGELSVDGIIVKEWLEEEYNRGYKNAQDEILEFLIDCVNHTDSVRKKLKKKVAEIRNSQIQTNTKVDKC